METDGYVQTYNELISKVGDKDVALAIMTNVAKDRRTVEINNKKGESSNGNAYGNGNRIAQDDTLATPKQLGWLRSHGIAARDGMTKAEASKMIDEAKMK